MQNGINGINLSYRIGNIYQKRKYTVLDAEFDKNNNLEVVGFYHFGDTSIYQVVFFEPVDPKYFAKTRFFKKNIWRDDHKFASYFCKHESKLFGININKFFELQQGPYIAKEKYIILGSLTKTSSKNLPDFKKEEDSLFRIVEHNLGCMIKEIILLTGLIELNFNFSSPYFRQNIKEKFHQVFISKIKPAWNDVS